MAQILKAILAGESIENDLEFVEDDGTVGPNLLVWFREWVVAGMFTRVELV